jgi:hypothetical protein
LENLRVSALLTLAVLEDMDAITRSSSVHGHVMTGARLPIVEQAIKLLTENHNKLDLEKKPFLPIAITVQSSSMVCRGSAFIYLSCRGI